MSPDAVYKAKARVTRMLQAEGVRRLNHASGQDQ